MEWTASPAQLAAAIALAGAAGFVLLRALWRRLQRRRAARLLAQWRLVFAGPAGPAEPAGTAWASAPAPADSDVPARQATLQGLMMRMRSGLSPQVADPTAAAAASAIAWLDTEPSARPGSPGPGASGTAPRPDVGYSSHPAR